MTMFISVSKVFPVRSQLANSKYFRGSLKPLSYLLPGRVLGGPTPSQHSDRDHFLLCSRFYAILVSVTVIAFIEQKY